MPSPASIAVIGNCQSKSIGHYLSKMIDVEVRRYGMRELLTGSLEAADIVKAHDLFFYQPVAADQLQPLLIDQGKRAFEYPIVYFAGYHPDLLLLNHVETARGPLVTSHSAIVMAAWSRGLSVSQTLSLFSEKVFRHLGYFDHWAEARSLFLEEAITRGLPLEAEFESWSRRHVFMYVPLHPKSFVLEDVARKMAITAGFEPRPVNEEFDDLARMGAFPVYPELAAALGVKGDYVFRTKRRPGQPKDTKLVFDLPEFVEASFEAYSKAPNPPKVARLSDPRYETLSSFVIPPVRRRKPQEPNNPYVGLPDYRYWRRAVAGLSALAVDPVTATKFKIARSTRIATAGSCFAQHIARTLKGSGYHYFVTEDGVGPNCGVFSARYGNIYTARQLLQLFDRAYGDFVPADKVWIRSDGRFIDPFRPEIEPDGFASADDVLVSRKQHFAAVRHMFEALDVFVFTLGLTEAWSARADGSVFPVAPGVVASSPRPEDYQFVNFSATEVSADLAAVLHRLKSVNPGANVIFTVSPVPLVATYEDRHVMVATTYSKSVLRVAADECARTHDGVDYFPSYEIVTGQYSRGAYFADDLRSVTDEGVSHVMRLFLKHYARSEPQEPVLANPQKPASLAKREFLAGSAVVCEEELLDNS